MAEDVETEKKPEAPAAPAPEAAPEAAAPPPPEPVPLGFRELPPIRAFSGPATAVAYGPSGRILVAGGSDGRVLVVDAISLSVTHELLAHSDEVTAMAVHPEEKFFASASKDRTVRVWDLATLEVKALLRGFTEGVTGVCFSPDGEQVAATSLDKSTRIFGTTTGKEIKALLAEVPVMSCAYFPGGGKLMVGAANSVVQVYDTEKWVPDGKPFKGSHGNWVSSVAFSANGKTFASGCLDRSVSTWDLRKGKEKSTFSGGRAWVQAVQVSPNGDYVLSSSRDGSVVVRGVEASEDAAVLCGRGAPLNDLAIFSRGTRLAAACADGTLQVWAMQGLEWPDWTPGGGAVEVVQEEEAAPSGPNPKYYASGKFDYKLWKSDHAHLFG